MRLFLCLLLLAIPCQAQEPPQEEWILQESVSPQGLTLQIVAPQNRPVEMRMLSHAKDPLWKKLPGDEANLRIHWNPEGTLLALITNNQETDRELWTINPKAQNHLVLLDPRDGTILQQADIDQILRLPEPQPPREHTLSWTTETIEVETTTNTNSWFGKIEISPQSQKELLRPKNIRTRTSIQW